MLTNPNKIYEMFTKVRSLPAQFPLVRGMVSYAIIWPTSSIAQEYIEQGGIVDQVNFARATRFGIFGAFFMAPLFYSWLKLSSKFFKRKSLRVAIKRAAIEQVVYSPFAVAYFFFGMSVLEGKEITSCVNEVRQKFWSTYTTGLMFWPIAQTVNFHFISERNRIIFVSAASFVWTIYLAHVKSRGSGGEKSIRSSTT